MIISVNKLNKTFKVPKKLENLSKWKQRLSWFYREWEDKIAVKDISFEIEEGEIVGYIGPNGAGKSTTIKMLTGILTPDKGEMAIMGFHPQKQRIKYTKHIGVVFGQRSSLEYNIPIKDSYGLFRAIYDIPKDKFKKRLDYMVDIIGIKELMEVPYRKLSLGEKMKAELVAAFLHKPKIVYLDEPTIGLDVLAKHKIREFLKKINQEEKVTIILTTHDMGDIEELANRIILIDKGQKMYDGTLVEFKKQYVNWKLVEIAFTTEPVKFMNKLEKQKIENWIENDTLFVKLPLDKNLKDFMRSAIDDVELVDIKIAEPLLETVVKKVYMENENAKD